jgi:hypothetical protein
VKNAQPIYKLTKDNWKLSKSTFVKGCQCHKSLYLENHKKNEKTQPSAQKLELFAQGFAFEENVRKSIFTDAVNVKEKVGKMDYIQSYTSYILNQPNKQVIFEATLIEEEVLVMCDAMVKDEDGKIDIYEIKFSKSINDAIMHDLSIQYYICKKRFGDKLRSFNLVMSKGTNDEWSIDDYAAQLESKITDIENKISLYKEILKNEEPKKSMGVHCDYPYECEFKAYCRKNSPQVQEKEPWYSFLKQWFQ